MSSPLLKKVLHKKKRRSRLVKFVDDPYKLYQLDTLLGEGAYGKVYLGVSLQDGKEYAIKIVHVTDDIVEVQKEINILKACNNEFVVRYYDSFIHRKCSDIWIILEYCHGGSIEDVIKILDRPLTEPEIRYILKDTLRGLQYLHENKRIHRDIKAGNILITKEGVAKLTDFGVSIELTNSMSKRNSLIGTPYWMAPEVIREVKYDEKADIWSIGITCIELAEKEPPLFRFQPMRALFIIPNRRPPTLQRPSDFSKDFQDFLSQCLKKEPRKRSSSKELLRHPFMIDTKKKVVLPKGKGHPLIHSLVEEVYKKLEPYGGNKEKYCQQMMKEKGKGKRSRGRRGLSNSSRYSSSDSSDDELTAVSDESEDESEYSDYESDSDEDDDPDNSSLKKKKNKKKKDTEKNDSFERKLSMFQSTDDEDEESPQKPKKQVEYSSPTKEEDESTSEYKDSSDENGGGGAPSLRKKKKENEDVEEEEEEEEEEDVLGMIQSNGEISDLKLKVMEMEEELEDLKQDLQSKNKRIGELEKKCSRLRRRSVINQQSPNNRKPLTKPRVVGGEGNGKNGNQNNNTRVLEKMKRNQQLMKKFLEIQVEFLKNPIL